MSRLQLLTIALLPVVLGGCFGNGQPKTALDSDAFYRAPPDTDERRHVLNDAPESPMYNQVRVDLTEPTPRPQVLWREAPPPPRSVTGVSDVIQQEVRLPTAQAAPAAAPATVPVYGRGTVVQPGVAQGSYMTVGAVVTEVSGTPIYADKVIAALSPLLSAEAKRVDERAFRALATREIEKQVQLMIRTELEYAAASRNLDQQEKTLADNLTMQWRVRQITEAGGSLELARRKSQTEFGMDFDDRVKEKHREFVVQLFYQKKVYPQVQVTADDMRQYYDKNLKTLFTEHDQAQFRLIKIEARKMGGREQAIDKIKDLHDRAARGDDFEKLAGTINHDPALMKSAGRVGGGDGWVQRGAFAIQKIEDAVWQLQPGQVGDVIEIGDSFYIAKLENRKLGRVRCFEDEDVQKQIGDTLRREQIVAKREQVQQKLLRDAVIYPYPPLIEPVMEIAMQRYAQWAYAH